MRFKTIMLVAVMVTVAALMGGSATADMSDVVGVDGVETVDAPTNHDPQGGDAWNMCRWTQPAPGAWLVYWHKATSSHFVCVGIWAGNPNCYGWDMVLINGTWTMVDFRAVHGYMGSQSGYTCP